MHIGQKVALSFIASATILTSSVVASGYGTVNGEEISQKDITAVLRNPNVKFESLPKQTQQQVLDRIVDNKLLKQHSIKDGIKNTDEFKKALKEIEDDLAIQVWIEKGYNGFKVTQQEIQKYYEKNPQMFQKPAKYKARHILVKTKPEAEAIIKELDSAGDKKAKFIELAKAKSTGPTGVKGGDLGWFDGNKMVPEFSAALKGMKAGEYSATPVKTQFGEHIIYLENSQPAQIVKFDEAKVKIEEMLKKQGFSNKLQTMLKDLKAKADIKLK